MCSPCACSAFSMRLCDPMLGHLTPEHTQHPCRWIHRRSYGTVLQMDPPQIIRYSAADGSTAELT